jgi:2'-5' RNA ligase
VDNFFTADLQRRWPPGQADYHWHVLPDPAQVGEHLTIPYQDLSARPCLAPVPSEWSHITVHHDVPCKEISEEAMWWAAGFVREECRSLRPFTATVRRPKTWRTAVVCPVYPTARFTELRAIVTRTSGIAGTQEDTAIHHPHMSIAYGIGRVDDRPMRNWLCDHDLPELEIQVTALTLVRQQHDSRTIWWDVIDVIPLGEEARQ